MSRSTEIPRISMSFQYGNEGDLHGFHQSEQPEGLEFLVEKPEGGQGHVRILTRIGNGIFQQNLVEPDLGFPLARDVPRR